MDLTKKKKRNMRCIKVLGVEFVKNTTLALRGYRLTTRVVTEQTTKFCPRGPQKRQLKERDIDLEKKKERKKRKNKSKQK